MKLPQDLPAIDFKGFETRAIHAGLCQTFFGGQAKSGEKRERICIELMTSDRKLKATREGSK